MDSIPPKSATADRVAKVHILTLGVVIVSVLLLIALWVGYQVVELVLEHSSFLIYLFFLVLALELYWMLYAILKRKLFEGSSR